MLSFESFFLQVSLLSFCTLQVQLSSIRLRPLSNPFVTLYHVLQAYLEGNRHCRSFLPYFLQVLPVPGAGSTSDHGVFYLRRPGLSHNSLCHSGN